MADDAPMLKNVRAELRRLRVTRDDAPMLYEAALQLAGKADECNSARDLPGLIRELRNCVEDITKLAPEKSDEGDGLDDLAARRSRRPAAS